MARAKRIPTRANVNLERSTRWSGLRPGDQVLVDVERELRATYVFVAHVRNVSTGDEWVEVRGGRTGESKDRSFLPDLIYAPNARHGSRILGPSLADAPRLPFE